MSSSDADSAALDDFLRGLVEFGVYGGEPVEISPEAKRAVAAMPVPVPIKQEEIENAPTEIDMTAVAPAAPILTQEQKELHDAIQEALVHPVAAYRVVRNLIEKADVFLRVHDEIIGLEDQAVVNLAAQLGASSLSARPRKH